MNKKKRKTICIILAILICVLGLAAVGLNKLRGHGYLSAVKGYIHYYMNKPDFSKYEPLKEKGNEWYQDNQLIAHALGGIEETEYTNSLEAFDYSLTQGYKVFEVDLSVTSDGRVVCSHGFEGFEIIPDYSTFMSTKINGKYTAIDLDQLLNRLTECPDIYVMTDFKWDNSFGSKNNDVEVIMNSITEGLTLRQNKVDYSLFDKIIIQVYNESNYCYIADNYPYKNYVYTLYNLAYPIYDEVAATCLKYNIPVVTMHYSRATKEHIELLDKWNIKIFSHTVNDKELAEEQKASGVLGLYTDWLLPEEMGK